MAKPEWGTKRTCYSCGARFYDLRREPIVCPICAGSAVYDPEKSPRLRRGAVARDEAPAVPQRGKADLVVAALDDGLVEDEVELEDLDDQVDADGEKIEDLATDERELIEDTSDLGEDDDDIGELMEHVSEEGDDKV